MELNQALRRIVGRHFPLFLLCTSLGLGFGYLVSAKTVPAYSAETRLVLDTQDPTGLAEAQTIADTARAIVTSPSEVRNVLRSAGAVRNALSVAQNDISVRALGSSGVLQLMVTDADPRVAAVVANKLSDDLIQTRLAVSQGGYEELHASLETKIANLTASLQRTTRNVNGPSGGDPRALARQAILQRQLSVAETSLSNLEAEQALRPKPEIIDRAEAPITANPSRWTKNLAFGGLAGALLGLGLAALLETFRPTIVGAGAIARELDAPPLGELPKRRNVVPRALAEKAQLAAISWEAKFVQLVAADPARDLSGLAESMQVQLHRALEETSQPQISPAAPRFRSFSANPTRTAEARATALIAVLPSSIAKTDLEPLESLLSITGYSLIGIMTYRPTRWYRRRDPLSPFSGEPDRQETSASASDPEAEQRETGTNDEAIDEQRGASSDARQSSPPVAADSRPHAATSISTVVPDGNADPAPAGSSGTASGREPESPATLSANGNGNESSEPQPAYSSAPRNGRKSNASSKREIRSNGGLGSSSSQRPQQTNP